MDSIYKGNSRITPVLFKVLVHPNKIDFGSSDNAMSKHNVLLFKSSTFHEHYPSGCLYTTYLRNGIVTSLVRHNSVLGSAEISRSQGIKCGQLIMRTGSLPVHEKHALKTKEVNGIKCGGGGQNVTWDL